MAALASASLTARVTVATALAASSSATRGSGLNAKSSAPLRCVTPLARPAVRCQQQPAPVAAAAAAPAAAVAALPFRVGHGFDLHRLEPNLPLIIGGVNIPHDRGCDAHSDGDVLLHCVVDAVLGALGLPDIGQLFPDNDPKWKGAASHLFLEEAVRRMHEAGYVVGNLDATVILQRPKLSPHKPTIKANLAALLQAPEEVINVKAKTHEKVDSLGENRSVGCHCVVLLMRKD
ncbi:hypothetical protein CLOM_g13795 [Closterium sp. NIES-68]|nr:hypothetical protein CLOM_g13795 [Closterium sp. NIES-68]GJP83604.1 hypothetical protein CLOP_g13736 [Closterium sp. NIES-67]